jgi:polygalacturonase
VSDDYIPFPVWPSPNPDGGTGVTVHNLLSGRSTENGHPISAITGLQAALDEMPEGAVDSVDGLTGAVNLNGKRQRISAAPAIVADGGTIPAGTTTALLTGPTAVLPDATTHGLGQSLNLSAITGNPCTLTASGTDLIQFGAGLILEPGLIYGITALDLSALAPGVISWGVASTSVPPEYIDSRATSAVTAHDEDADAHDGVEARVDVLEARRWFTNLKLDHDAVGDGVVDDTEAFEAATAEAASNGGGFIFVPDGTYRIRRSIRLPSNTTLFGEGPAATLITRDQTVSEALTANAAGAQAVVVVADASGFAVGDGVEVGDSGNFGWDATQAVIEEIDGNTITLDRNLATGYTTASDATIRTLFPMVTNAGGYLAPTSHINVKDLAIDQNRGEDDVPLDVEAVAGFTFACVHWEASYDSHVEGVHLLNAAQDAYSDQCRAADPFTRNSIHKSLVVGSGGHGVHIGSSTSGARIALNWIEDCGDMAVFLCANAAHTVVSHNVIVNCLKGVAGGDGRDATVEDGDGPATDSTTEANLRGDTHTTITGNTFIGGALNASALSTFAADLGPRSVFVGNTIKDWNGGVRLFNFARDCVVADNHIGLNAASGRSGIVVNQGAHRAKITNNVIVCPTNEGQTGAIAVGSGAAPVNDVMIDNVSAFNVNIGLVLTDEVNRLRVTNLTLRSGIAAPVRIIGTTTDCHLDLAGVFTTEAATLISYQDGVGAAAQVRLLVNGVGDNGTDNPATAGQWNGIGTGALARRYDGVKVRWDNDGTRRLSMFDQPSGGWLVLTDPAVVVANTQVADYTLAAADAGKVVEMNSADPETILVPTNVAVPFPVGTVIELFAAGAGTVTIAGDTGVTVRNGGALAAQYATASLRKRATNEWVLSGDLA